MSDSYRMTTRSFRTALAVLAALAMAIALLPGSVAHATDGTLDARDTADACENAPETDFADEPFDNDELTQATDCIGAEGWGAIVEGFEDGTYGPGENVRRDQMASMIVRKIETVDPDLIPADPPNAFPDDDDNETHEANINIAADLGIVQGDADGNYNDKAPVSRQQMASFVNGQIEAITGAPLASGGDDLFADDCNEAHEANVEALAWFHIVQGDAEGNFNCLDLVTRADIALFVTRDLDHLVENGHAENPFPRPTNQAFDVSQDDELAMADTTATYTFTGLDPDTDYDVYLFPCYDDAAIQNGNVTSFLDTNEDDVAEFEEDDNLDGDGDTQQGSAEFASINGDTAVAGDDEALDLAPSSQGEFVVVVGTSTDTSEDCARVLVFEDDGDDTLGLDADNLPTEPFAISGRAAFHNGEAPLGEDPHETVVYVDTSGDGGVILTADGFLYFYDADDQFCYEDCDFVLSMDEFEQYINMPEDTSDELDQEDTSAYNPGGVNHWNLDHDDMHPPTNLALDAVGDLDGEADDEDAEISWEAPEAPNGWLEEYHIRVYDDTGQADCDASGDVSGFDPFDTDSTDTTALLEDIGPGDYCAEVESETVEGGESVPSEPLRFTVPFEDPPIIESAELTNDAVVIGQADTGDVWTLEFNEDMDEATIETSGQLTLEDSDGDLILVDCGATPTAGDNVTAATCDVDPASAGLDVLEITLDEGAEDRNAAGDGDILYPLEITDTNDIHDADDGAEVDLANSTDTTIG